jgi:hypothetical protein
MGDLAIDMTILLKWMWCSVVVQDRYQWRNRVITELNLQLT